MPYAIRGQEVVIAITVGDAFAAQFGLFGQLAGSFFKVRDFTLTARTDITEEPYLGEQFDDLDIQHHGWDFSFSIDEVDAEAINFMDLVVYKDGANLPPPEVAVSATYTYRSLTLLPKTEQLTGCILRLAEKKVGGRKEKVQNSFEGKAKFKTTL